MFNDNLPVGSAYVSGGDGGTDGAGYIIMEHENKLYLLAANNTEIEKKLSVKLVRYASMTGRMYNLHNLGINISEIDGEELVIAIPAYSGIAYKEI